MSTQSITIDRHSTREQREAALKAIYHQILERQPYDSEHHLLAKIEKEFLNGRLGVRHFIGELTTSQVYLDQFYENASNSKFIESCMKHLLGRVAKDNDEVRHYADMLMRHGASHFIHDILGSDEYRKAFGCFTVPFPQAQKFYDSPRNYMQSNLVNHEHFGQRGKGIPTIYWQALGLDCETGECIVPDHGSVTQPNNTASHAPAASTQNNETEIEELLEMLRQDDARKVLQQMTDRQKQLLREFVRR
ncbi:MAG: phycobilisome rod-core linker polypeptide [Pseudanabaenaceae cyanobacterium]|jgi:phycoerythrin-associated linker protein